MQYVFTLQTHCIHANLLCSCGCMHLADTLQTHYIHIADTLQTTCLHANLLCSCGCMHLADNMYSHCIHIAYTRKCILQCAYQLQIGYIYSVYTITGTYVHMYIPTCKVNTHLLVTCLHAHTHVCAHTRARVDHTLTDLPYIVRFSSTISVGP